MKIKSLVAAAAMAVAATGAHATIDSGYDFSFGNGETLFVAVDDVAKVGYVLDTGIRYNTLQANKASGTVTSFDLDAAFTAAFAGSTKSNIKYNVFAASRLLDLSGNPVGAPGFGEIYGSNFAGVLTQQNVNLVNNLIQLVNTFKTQVQATVPGENSLPASSTAINRSYVIPSSSFSAAYTLTKNVVTNMNNLVGTGGTAQIVGAKEAMYYTTILTSDTGAFSQKTELFANMVFDIDAAGVGKVSINTPVPAAAWLLVSGLAGFGAISRRRKQQA